MKTNLKSLRFRKQTISILNGKKIYGGTDPNFTRGCPPSVIDCHSLEPHRCPHHTEQPDCHLSEVPECHTDFLCETDYC
ncbi:hypothetical protein [uncultured Kordia sp.]|uniref:hypothetical protein n=1 Tax=uncultured Kordia sp. TaxID=507699 RepID=UPI002606DDB3|nr:hypothetical protein [uncultured Kordia sp.]